MQKNYTANQWNIVVPKNYNFTSVDGKKLDGTAGQLVKPNELNIE